MTVSRRPYRSPRRDASATQTRERIVKAANAILGAADGIRDFSLEAVARKAGVTRLTVYNHFGSRRALLEAAFDQRAERGRFHRIAEIMAVSEPHAALRHLVDFFCDFWSSDPTAIGLLHCAGAADPEIAESLRARLERRRGALATIVRRLGADRLAPRARAELVDTLFALTSFEFFAHLTEGGRSADAAGKLIRDLAADAVERALSMRP